MDGEDLLHGGIHIVLARILRKHDVDRERSTRYVEDRHVAEKLGKLCAAGQQPFLPRTVYKTHTFSAFIVADVTINFMSLLRAKTKRVQLTKVWTSCTSPTTYFF